ncbi:hypothetical protein [Prosthecobacter sp.]|jgi:hypothetical protein|uniref:hypothetical protein n=1 Tax=Prosthecobacter sp. TaxID=1965333 RepID=UPI0037C9DA29
MIDSNQSSDSGFEKPLPASSANIPPALPASSRAALGCLALPALTGGCSILLLAVAFFFAGASWLLTRFGGEPFHIGIPSLHGDWLSWAWFFGCLIACRAILAEKRKPWVYWLVSLCLALTALVSLGSAWFKISWPGASDDQSLVIGQWLGFAIIISLLCWFVLGKQSRRYYRVSVEQALDR